MLPWKASKWESGTNILELRLFVFGNNLNCANSPENSGPVQSESGSCQELVLCHFSPCLLNLSLYALPILWLVGCLLWYGLLFLSCFPVYAGLVPLVVRIGWPRWIHSLDALNFVCIVWCGKLFACSLENYECKPMDWTWTKLTFLWTLY